MSDPFRDVEEATKGGGDAEAPIVTYWRKEIDLSKKREKKFRKDADKICKIYEATKEDDNNFNILYANTMTLLPAIYNNTPRPIVERRFHDPDPLAKAASDCLERTLKYLTDNPTGGYEQYDDLWSQAALGALVPGRGVTRFKYDPEIKSASAPVEHRSPDEGDTDEANQVASEQEVTGELTPKREKVVWETICGEDVDYDKFLMGYARRWVDMPWIAYEHAMSKEDAVLNFGKAVADKMKFRAPVEHDKSGWKVEDEELHNRGSTETATVYEIWWKQRRKVVFYDPELKEQLCKVVDDPYGLSGFYNCPEPLMFYVKRSTLVPTSIYKAYEVQAKQLNRITMRISRVTNALKVRGFYDATIQGLKELLNAEDNTMIPAKNAASMQQGQNLQNSIWTMPLQELAGVLEKLYGAQENAKNTIYEITGIADIMRGDTQASETATAQNIKSKWGTVRLQQMQGAMQKYVRDCMRIVGELAGDHFGQQTFAAMTNLDFVTSQQVRQATLVMQQVQQMMLQQQTPPQPPAPGSPPPQGPPPMPPQMQQAAQQAQAVLAKPRWDDVLKLLSNDLIRSYRIDIETNSTLVNTSQEDQQNITEAMGAISNMYQSFLPAIQVGAMTMPALKEMMLSVCRRFEFGRQVEGAIAAMPDQLPPPPPDPKVDAALQDQREDLMNQQLQLKGQMVDIEKAKGEMSTREALLGVKAKEVSQNVEQAKQEVAMTAKETLSEQKQRHDEFLLAMEKRLTKHELAMTKGIAKQKAQQDDHAQKVKGAIADHEIKAKKAEATTKDTESVLPKVVETLDKIVDTLKELEGHRRAPIKIVHGKDGKAAQVVVGETTRSVKHGPNGDMELS